MRKSKNIKLAAGLLTAILIVVTIFLCLKPDSSLISKINEYGKNNYSALGLINENDSVIVSTKELYEKDIISKYEYEKYSDIVFKITLDENKKVIVNQYSNEYDFEKPIIILNGPTTITLEYGESYVENGYTVEDNKDNNLTDSVKVDGVVNSNKIGTYKITYEVSDKSNNIGTATRKVYVVDTKAPKLKLAGQRTVSLYVGEKYKEAGIESAIDNVDGDVSDSLMIDGSVSSNKVGSYLIRYSVSDKSNNMTTLERIVNVVRVSTTTTTTAVSTAPVIVLNGSSIVSIYHEETYIDLGIASAIDKQDGDIKNRVITTSNVNTNIIGGYEVTYSVTNSKGLTTTARRVVNVIKAPSSLVSFEIFGLTSNMIIPGTYEENIARTFTVYNGIDQYGDEMALTNITWTVNKTGTYITDGVLSISKNASIGSLEIKATINGIEKTKTASLIKVPKLYTFDIIGDNSLSISGIADMNSSYSIDNGIDQYGDSIAIDANNSEWSIIDEPDNVSISTSGQLSLNASATLGDITIRNKNGDAIQTKLISLNKIGVTSISLKDDDIEINDDTLELMVGESKEITYELTPSNSTSQSGTWSSSNSNKVSINNGTLNVVDGNTNDVIDISLLIDGIEVTFEVKIIAPPVKYNFDSLEMEYGDEEIVTATPRSGTVVYSTSNQNIATVNSSTGKITITGVGDVVITATVDGLGSDTLNILAKKAVVDVILFCGQSNMMGAATSASNEIPDEGTAWEYRNSTNSLKYLTSAVGEASGSYASASYAASLLTSFAKEYVSSVGRKVVAVHSPKDGSNIDAWQPSQGVLVTAETRYNNAITYLQSSPNFTVGRKLFVWLQGESNMPSAGTKSAYKTSFLNMKNDLITNSGISQFLIIRVGNQPLRQLDYVKEILYAQNELAYENSDIIMATKNAYNVSQDATLMNTDMLHFNNLGLDFLGGDAAANYASYLTNGEEPFMYDLLIPQKIANRWTYTSNIHDSVGGINSSIVSGSISNSNDKIVLDGNSYVSLDTNISLLSTKMWAIDFTTKINDSNSNGMLLTHIDNSDAYLWLDGSTNQIRLRSSASTEVTFEVDPGDLTTINEWRLEYLPLVKEITLFKNNEYFARESYTDVTNFSFDGMYGGYKTSEYLYNFNGVVEDITIYNDEVLTIYMDNIDLNLTSTNLYVGQTYQISYTINPLVANNKNVTFESSNASIATVNSSGLIAGVSAGTATITVRSADGNTQSSGTVIVSGDSVPVTGVTLNKSAASIRGGATETLVATVVPYYAGNSSVTWSSSDTNVATVNSSGVVTGVNNGTATITATTVEGNFTATCTVTINSFPGLWQGTKTRNGMTVTISGNHITINGTKNTTDAALGTAYYTDNHIILYEPSSVWYTFLSGTQVSVIVSNNTGTVTNPIAVNSIFGLRRNDNNILAGATFGTRTGTFNYTFSSNTAVYGFLFYLSAGQIVTNYQFDVEFWVNGERWF